MNNVGKLRGKGSSPFSIANVHGVMDNTIAYEAIISGSNPDERTTAY